MKITSLQELENAKKIVLEMKAQATNDFVISVFNQMLDELNRGDVETIYTPSYFSIINFGYDIFKNLRAI
jgi:hypothetical protein